MSGTTCISSGLLSASAAVYTNGRGTLNGLQVFTDGTNAATVTLYDNASAASGTVLMKEFVPGAQGSHDFSLNLACRCLNGIYASISGTGAGAIVYFGA